MRTLLLAGLLLASCDSCQDAQLTTVCGGACVVVDGQILESGTDPCAGVLKCDSDGEQTCSGYRESYPETCNGVDDDCDGDVDEGVDFVPRQEGSPCLELRGECQKSAAACVGGEYLCTHAPSPEACNDLDDDCDGYVDEDIGVLGFDYSGPPETASVGECRPGVVRCRNGEPTSEGEVLPEPEQCGDEKDSDCDGALNPDGGVVAHDVVLVIDFSGSMSFALGEVAQAVCDWGDADRAEHNFAVIAVSPDAHPDGTVEVLFDFQPPDQACLDLMAAVRLGGGFEFMLDGIMLAHREPLSFSGAPKDMLVFTDEPIQENAFMSYDVERDCVDNEYRVTVFTEYAFASQWDDIVQTCGGGTAQLSGSGQMRDELLDIFGTYCSR